MTIIAVNLKVRLHGGQPLSDDFERSFTLGVHLVRALKGEPRGECGPSHRWVGVRRGKQQSR